MKESPATKIEKESSVSQTEDRNNCDPSYPDVCIESPPPDLDCGDISEKNFKVIGSDPHRFDPDGDGIGCGS
jgi:micrococcal nuclease